MTYPRRKMLRIAALGIGALAIAPIPVLSPARAAIGKVDVPADPKALRFRVLWKGDEIGHHNVTITPTGDGDGMTVVTNIRMKVKVGPFTAFRFEHDSTEAWRNGLLQSLVSKTHDDGDDLAAQWRSHRDSIQGGRSEGRLHRAGRCPDHELHVAARACRREEDHRCAEGPARQSGIQAARRGACGRERQGPAGGTAGIRTPFVGGSLWYDLAGNWVRSRLEIKGETLEYSLVA